jgi:hypothetical protein
MIVYDTRVASPTLYWPADEVGSQTPGRLWLGDLSLHYNSCHMLSICLVEIHWCLVLYAKSCGRAELGRLRDLLEGLEEVAWAANLVGWAHWQVGGSFGRPDLLVRDDREPSRWGPGVPMSHREGSHDPVNGETVANQWLRAYVVIPM